MRRSMKLVMPALLLILLTVGLTVSSAAQTITPPGVAGTPTAVSLTPAESWSCIMSQQSVTASLMGTGGPVGNGRVEFMLNRFPDAVGDIVEVAGGGPTKLTNTYATVYTDGSGYASATLVATRPGDTDVTAFAPGIRDADAHKDFGVVHWVDGCPEFPADAENRVGTPHPMTVSVLRVSDGGPVADVSVRWTITDDDPDASFAGATGDGNTIVVPTNASGLSNVTLEQTASATGDNSVLIEVLNASGQTMFSHTAIKRWRAPDLQVEATGPETVGLLSEATYDITVSNTGDTSAGNAVLTMTLPSGLSFVSATNEGTAAGQVVTWNLGDLEVDQTVTLGLTASATAVGVQTSAVSVESDEGIGDDTTVDTTVIAGGLELTMTGPESVAIGSEATYTLVVTGTGTGASTGVTLVNTVPDGMSYVSSNAASATEAGSDVTFSLGELSTGDTVTVEVVLQADQTGDWTNAAAVSSAEGAAAEASVVTTVVQPVLDLTMTGPDSALLGTSFDYVITVSNNGDGNATEVTVVDTLPVGLTMVSSTPVGTVSGSTITWNVGTLLPNGSATITLRVQGTLGGAQENVATASSGGGGTFQPEARKTTEILVPALSVDKAGPTARFVGTEGTYTITATNTGTAPLNGVTITETIPSGMRYVSSSPAGSMTVSGASAQVVWSVGALEVGASSSVMVTLEAIDEGTHTNAVSAVAAGNVTASDTLDIDVLAAPGATISITDSDDPITEGQQVTFTVTVDNQGRSNMTLVNVEVQIRESMTIVSVSDGATASADGRTVTFAYDGALAPGDDFTFTITVQANQIPVDNVDDRIDVVTTATLTYEQFTQPVSADEGTTIIGE